MRQKITFTMDKDTAEKLSLGMSDLLCWCNGFNAALSPSEDYDRRPMGVFAAREINIALKRAIDEAEESAI